MPLLLRPRLNYGDDIKHTQGSLLYKHIWHAIFFILSACTSG